MWGEERKYSTVPTLRKTHLPIFPVKTVLASMNMVAELGAKVVERKLVDFPINHHLALRDPVGHSARGSPEEGIGGAFVTRRLVKAEHHISGLLSLLPRVDDRVHCCSKGEKTNLKGWGGKGDQLHTCLTRPFLNFCLRIHRDRGRAKKAFLGGGFDRNCQTLLARQLLCSLKVFLGGPH